MTYEDRLCFLTRSPGDVKGTGGRCPSGKIKQHWITKAAYGWGWGSDAYHHTHAPPSPHSSHSPSWSELPSTELTPWTRSEISCCLPPRPLNGPPWAGPGQGFLPGVNLPLGCFPSLNPIWMWLSLPPKSWGPTKLE